MLKAAGTQDRIAYPTDRVSHSKLKSGLNEIFEVFFEKRFVFWGLRKRGVKDV